MYKFSINVLVNSLDDFKEFYSSIIQEIDDFSYAEFLFYDKTISNYFRDYFNKIKKDYSFITYIDIRECDEKTFYNRALTLSNGKYLNITNASLKYTHDYLYKVGYYIEDNDYSIIALSDGTIRKNSHLVDLSKEDLEIDDLSHYFFKRDIIGLTTFDEDISIDISRLKFLLTIILKTNNYYMIKEVKIKTKKIFSLNDSSYYLDQAKDILGYLKEINNTFNSVPLFIQKLILKLLLDRYAYNIDNNVLTTKDEKKFYKLTSKILDFIDSDIILNFDVSERWLLFYLCDLKNNNITFNTSLDFSKESFTITKLDYSEGDFIIEGYCSLSNLGDGSLYVMFAGKRWQALTSRLLIHKLFSTNIYQVIYKFIIPINSLVDDTITINFEKDSYNYLLNLNFSKVTSKINKSIFSYWEVNKYLIFYQNNTLKISSQKDKNKFKKLISHFNIMNLYHAIVNKIILRRNIVVLFTDSKKINLLLKHGYKVYSFNDTLKDKRVTKLRNRSYYSKLIMGSSKIIISDNKKDVIDYLDIDNSYYKKNFKADVLSEDEIVLNK